MQDSKTIIGRQGMVDTRKSPPYITPPIRTIKTPIRLLITRITALNTPRIAHLIESRRQEICESVLFSRSYFRIADRPSAGVTDVNCGSRNCS
jgi:hypothetical protein